jgi:TetR/AcrR family transcriptional repressor for divergent bdcA
VRYIKSGKGPVKAFCIDAYKYAAPRGRPRRFDPEAREAARALTAAAENAIRRFVAATHPKAAEQMTDYVVILMVGLSTMARSGHDVHRLHTTARFAALGIAQALRA